jgi:putative peptidoglycan lipid II flippase
VKQSVYISIVVTIQLLVGFASQILIIRILGIGIETDAYIAAQAIPLVTYAIISNAMQIVWLPRFSVLVDDPLAGAREHAKAQGQAIILCAPLISLVFISLSLWMPFILPGFSNEQLSMAANLCLVLMFASLFNVLSSVLMVALRATDRFLVGEIVTLVGSLSSLAATILLLPLWGIEVVVWIALARAIGVYLAQLMLTKFPGISIKKGWQDQQSWRLMRPLLFGSSIYKTSPLVDRFWASQAPMGGVTMLNLAQIAMAALATILERALCMPKMPSLARYVLKRDYAGLRYTYRKAIFLVTLSVLLIGACMLLLRPVFIDLVSVILQLSNKDAANLWLLCVLLLGYLQVGASGTMPVAAFTAMGNTKTPVKVGIYGFLFGLVLKALGFIFFQLPGLVVATSVYYLLNMFVNCLLLEIEITKKLTEESLRPC